MRLDIIALERLRKKRWQKKLKRADKKARKALKKQKVTVKPTHPALLLLRKNLRGEKRPPPPPKDGRYIIEIPKVFSFTDDPEAVLNVIDSLLSIPANRTVRQIFIDHSRCEQMDLGASAVFDVCALYVFGEQSRRHRNFSYGGRLPANKHVDSARVWLLTDSSMESENAGRSLLPRVAADRLCRWIKVKREQEIATDHPLLSALAKR